MIEQNTPTSTVVHAPTTSQTFEHTDLSKTDITLESPLKAQLYDRPAADVAALLASIRDRRVPSELCPALLTELGRIGVVELHPPIEWSSIFTREGKDDVQYYFHSIRGALRSDLFSERQPITGADYFAREAAELENVEKSATKKVEAAEAAASFGLGLAHNILRPLARIGGVIGAGYSLFTANPIGIGISASMIGYSFLPHNEKAMLAPTALDQAKFDHLCIQDRKLLMNAAADVVDMVNKHYLTDPVSGRIFRIGARGEELLAQLTDVSPETPFSTALAEKSTVLSQSASQLIESLHTNARMREGFSTADQYALEQHGLIYLQTKNGAFEDGRETAREQIQRAIFLALVEQIRACAASGKLIGEVNHNKMYFGPNLKNLDDSTLDYLRALQRQLNSATFHDNSERVDGPLKQSHKQRLVIPLLTATGEEFVATLKHDVRAKSDLLFGPVELLESINGRPPRRDPPYTRQSAVQADI